MEKCFNTEGQCIPELHYMVKLDDRLDRIKRFYIDGGKYFIINRGRQYGKTTTLYALEKYLEDEYIVVSLDFQGISTAEFSDEYIFTKAFMRMFAEALEDGGAAMEEVRPAVEFMEKTERSTLSEMFYVLSNICKIASKPIVMMIDEVDNTGNNQVFIDFLALLRMYYLKRRKKPIFHSVVLAGVYDIKNLKLKIRPEENHQYNSPWNIAAVFDVDMSFSADQIAAMLNEYEKDQHVGMDVKAVSEEIYQYTSGYPYLVSAICKILDEELSGKDGFTERFGSQGYGNRREVWSNHGVTEAVKMILNQNAPLFDSMVKQLDVYRELRDMLEELIYQGKRIPFSPVEKSINLGFMFGFLKNVGGYVGIANRIFEMYLLNLFIAEEAVGSEIFFYGQGSRNQFVKDAKLDMKLVLEKFVIHFTEIYGSNDEKFTEKYGRKFFLLYLKPIINGRGNYYLEAQTRDARRTDVIVEYAGEQFIVELKIWYGNEYHERGQEQLAEYLDYYHQDKGYLLSFNFNKNKKIGVREVQIGSKTIVEAVV